ncbi:MAG: dihydrodipicolinate synthase family protein [Verrucomicrobiales bacterium]
MDSPPTQRYPQSHLVACVIPWTSDDKPDTGAFERHVQAAIEADYRCLYIFGTAGEGYAVSETGFRQVVSKFARLSLGGGRDPQVGIMGLSMQTMIERIRWCVDQGIEMFQISLPAWGPLDDKELMVFFETVCGTFPDCRFLHYNLPRTKRVLTGADYRRVASAVPNLVATKNSSTDYARTADLLRESPELQHFLLESNYAMGCTVGRCSLLCSLGGLLPKLAWRLFGAGMQGDVADLFRVTDILHGLKQRLFSHCERAMIDGAYDKAFAWLRDPTFSPRLLPPYIGMSESELARCRQIFEAELADLG